MHAPRKHTGHSALLGRDYHLDVVGDPDRARWLLLLFGGSGITVQDYRDRADAVHPALAQLASAPLVGAGGAMIYATAPYDVPFARFHEDTDAMYDAVDTWNAHVDTELLAPWRALPLFVAGYSGGARLALWGVHELPRCRAWAALAGDGLPAALDPPATGRPAALIYNRGDRVLGRNRAAIEGLEARGVARLVLIGAAGHRHPLADHVASGAFGLLVEEAIRAFSTPPLPAP